MAETEEKPEKVFKIIILGSNEAGKQYLLNRYFNNDLKGNILSTIGIDYQTKFFKFDGHKIKCNYVDTAGQEKFRAISRNYLKGADGVILVFDITNRQTLESLYFWLRELEDVNKADISKILIGNKADLEDERMVSIEDGEKLAQTIKCKYFEASAKNGKNVVEAFDEIARIIFNNLSNSNRVESFVLSSEEKKNKKKYC